MKWRGTSRHEVVWSLSFWGLYKIDVKFVNELDNFQWITRRVYIDEEYLIKPSSPG